MLQQLLLWPVLALLQLLGATFHLPAVQQQVSETLRFNENGHFKILQVADMHYANGAATPCEDVFPKEVPYCSDLNTSSFLSRVIAKEKPDLVVFTGDNIYGHDCKDPVVSLNAAFAPAIAAKVPWAAVLGNHDQESTLTREQLMSHIVKMNYTLSLVNPSPAPASIDGYGNYNLEVHGSASSDLKEKSILNLYFIDSGDYSTVSGVNGYGWIKASQQVWLKNVSEHLREVYQRAPHAQTQSAPGLTYFHIPIPEVGTLTTSDFMGMKQEAVGSANINSGFLTTLLEAGDVKAVFTGHDHVNDFCGAVHGIYLCYSGGFGYHAYGKAGWPRRARVVLASLEKVGSDSWGGVKNITTWKRLDDGLLSAADWEILWSKA